MTFALDFFFGFRLDLRPRTNGGGRGRFGGGGRFRSHRGQHDRSHKYDGAE